MRLLRRRQFGDIWRANSAIQSAFAHQHQIVQRGREVGFDFHYTQPVDTRRARWNLLVGIDYAADNMAGWKARYGVELRSPTSDRRLAEFCLALPEDQYLRHGVTRSLIRRAYRERLPASVLDNNLRGLQSPDWHELLCRERDALALEVMHLREHPLASRCLDVARLERLFLHWPRDGWHQPDIFRNYHLLLTRSLMVGRFIRWFDQGQSGTP
jgi:asparagine synthase (glutamine-hydrolysing)